MLVKADQGKRKEPQARAARHHLDSMDNSAIAGLPPLLHVFPYVVNPLANLPCSLCHTLCHRGLLDLLNLRVELLEQRHLAELHTATKRGSDEVKDASLRRIPPPFLPLCYPTPLQYANSFSAPRQQGKPFWLSSPTPWQFRYPWVTFFYQ